MIILIEIIAQSNDHQHDPPPNQHHLQPSSRPSYYIPDPQSDHHEHQNLGHGAGWGATIEEWKCFRMKEDYCSVMPMMPMMMMMMMMLMMLSSDDCCTAL